MFPLTSTNLLCTSRRRQQANDTQTILSSAVCCVSVMLQLIKWCTSRTMKVIILSKEEKKVVYLNFNQMSVEEIVWQKQTVKKWRMQHQAHMNSHDSNSRRLWTCIERHSDTVWSINVSPSDVFSVSPLPSRAPRLVPDVMTETVTQLDMNAGGSLHRRHCPFLPQRMSCGTIRWVPCSSNLFISGNIPGSGFADLHTNVLCWNLKSRNKGSSYVQDIRPNVSLWDAGTGTATPFLAISLSLWFWHTAHFYHVRRTCGWFVAVDGQF